MSEHFAIVVKLGFYINCSILLYFLMKVSLCRRKNPYKWFFPLLHFSWVIQFVWMIVIRFMFQGRVCSGDYKEYSAASSDPKQRLNYDGYFLEGTGSFFWWYVIILFSLFTGCSCCFMCMIWCHAQLTQNSIMAPM